MPYISQEQREKLTNNLLLPKVKDAGELNWLITVICRAYIKNTGVKYETLNSVIGVLECAKQELYRRMVSPYEDEKCKENGDVYFETKTE